MSEDLINKSQHTKANFISSGVLDVINEVIKR